MSIYRICAECGETDGGWTGLCLRCQRQYESEFADA
jgi:predicted ATP-dependent serine protease